MSQSRFYRLLPLLILAIMLCEGHAVNIFFNSMKFTKAAYQYNPLYYSNLSAWVDNGGGFNTEMWSRKVFDFGVNAAVDVQIKLTDSKHYQSLFKYKIDVCHLLNQQYKNTLLKIWFRNLVRHGNLMENCPILKGHYYVRNFTFEAASIPAYLRLGNYRLIVEAFYGKLKVKKERFILKYTLDMSIY